MKNINTETIKKLMDENNVKELRDIFIKVPPIDLADCCNELEDIKDLVFLFRYVKSEYTADLFAELKQEKKEELINALSDGELATLLLKQANDDVTDFIEELPANVVSRVLKNVQKDKRNQINALLNYKEHTAGSIMTTEYLELLDTFNVDEAIQTIRKIGKEKETILTLFIRDKERSLVGELGLDDLIFANSSDCLKDIMNKTIITVNVNTDQEEVAKTMKRYDLHAIPVLNDDQKLVGIITIDDALDVMEDEVSEDFIQMGHVSPIENSYLQTGVIKLAFKSVPWLIILMVLGVFTSLILSNFQDTLALLPVLTVFIPLLMDAGGNAGNQSTTLIIRGLAIGEIKVKDYFKIVWKEFRVALLCALILAIACFSWLLIEMYIGIVNYPLEETLATLDSLGVFKARLMIALAVTITIFVDVIFAKILGVSLPIFVKLIKLDPALISSPFLTTIIDIITLVIYFVTSVYILHLVV